MVVMGRRFQDVEEVFTSLVKQTNKMGSEITGEKAKFTVVFQKLYN